MTAAYSSAQQARQRIASRLRELRLTAELAGNELSALCGWHKAKTSRIENGKTSPSPDDLRAWCRACGAEDEAADLIVALHAAEGMFIEWRRMERSGLLAAQRSVEPLFERTKRFRAYSSWLIPGMIQTPAYIQQVLRNAQQRRRLPDDVDQAVAARVERQRLLTEGGRLFAFLIEESVLRSDTASPLVMSEQLDHLATIAKLPGVSLGVIPRGVGRGHRPVEGFWIFDNAQVNVELVSGYLTVTQPREIRQYAETFSALHEHAVFGAEARALITRARSRLLT